MKFATLILAVLAATATASVVEPVPGPVPALASDLEARSCVASKCRCNKVQGQFCGNQAVNAHCTNGHVFECSTSGSTCDYGKRNSCVKCGKLSC